MGKPEQAEMWEHATESIQMTVLWVSAQRVWYWRGAIRLEGQHWDEAWSATGLELDLEEAYEELVRRVAGALFG